MKQFLVIALLGIAFFLSGAYFLGLFDSTPIIDPPPGPNGRAVVAPESKLGEYLYAVAPFPEIKTSAHRSADPLVLYGIMNPLELEEVSSPGNGKILFIGEQVADDAVLAAGSAAF